MREPSNEKNTIARTMLAISSPVVRRSARTAWVLTSLQLVNVDWFGLCVWAALTQVAHFAGLVYVPHRGNPWLESPESYSIWWRVFAR